MGQLQISTVQDREELFRAVWKEPAYVVAEKYEISGTAIAKWCRKLEIPLPGRGYWAKRAAGKEVPQPPELPPVSKEVTKCIRGYAIKWKDLEAFSEEELVSGELFQFLEPSSIDVLLDYSKRFVVSKQLRDPGELVLSILASFEEAKEQKKKEIERWKQIRYWHYSSEPKPHKRYPFDLSPKNEKRVLRIVDTLDKTLFEIEGRIRESERFWSAGETSYRLNIVLLMHSFVLYFDETEEGDLMFRFQEDRNTKAFLAIQDKENDLIESHIGEAIETLCILADKQRGHYELKHRKEQREWAEYKRQQEIKRQQEAERKFYEAVLQCADSWAEAESLRSFVAVMVEHRATLDDGAKAKALDKMVERVEKQILLRDPFIEFSDKTLGESANIWALGEGNAKQ